MKNTILLLLLLLQLNVKAQAEKPGGIDGAIKWFTCSLENNNTIVWKNKLESNALFEKKIKTENAYLNFNAAIPFNAENKGFEIPLNDQNLRQFTLFIVYHPTDTLQEKIIWSLENEHYLELASTTNRMADLEQGKYMNYLNTKKDLPRINTYFQHKKDNFQFAQNNKLHLGKQPTTSNLPVQSFKGMIPELILFDRILSPKELIKIESYLAIKYGLTLSNNKSIQYVSANNIIIWDSQKDTSFHTNITGVGKDKISGLNQKQSTSSYEPKALTVSIGDIAETNEKNDSKLEDESFLMWADDGLQLNMHNKMDGQPLSIERNWLMQVSGDMSAQATHISFDTRRMKSNLSGNEIYWLSIDRSGTGAFPLEDVEYYPMSYLKENGDVIFENIYWDTDGSGYDRFTLAKAPKMFASFWIDQPTCTPMENGQMTISITGGQPSYFCELKNLETEDSQQWTTTENNLTINDLHAGKYIFYLNDLNGNIFSEKFFVQSSDAIVADIGNTYELKKGQTLSLNAAKNNEAPSIIYEWTTPDGKTIPGASIHIYSPGEYQLSISKDGCTSRQTIQVFGKEDNFASVLLFPNPIAKNATFNIRIELNVKEDIQASCYSENGHLLFSEKLKGSDLYLFSKKINAIGKHLMILEGEHSYFVEEIIVQ